MIGRLSSRFSSFWLHLRNWINILNQNPQHKTPVITAVKETNKSWWQSGDIHNYYSYGIVFSACTHAHSHTQSVGNIYGSLAIEFELRPQLEGVWRSTGLVPKAGPKVLSSFEVAATAVAVAFEVHGLIGRASRRCKPISPGFLIGSRGLVWRGEAEMQTAKVALATHFIKVNSYLHEKCLPLKLINGFTLILQLKIDAAAAAVRRASTSPIWICPPVETMDRKGRSKTRDWIIEGSRSRSHLATWPKTEIALKIECLAGGACKPQIIYDIKSRDSKRRLMPDKGKGQRINCNLCFFLRPLSQLQRDVHVPSLWQPLDWKLQKKNLCICASFFALVLIISHCICIHRRSRSLHFHFHSNFPLPFFIYHFPLPKPEIPFGFFLSESQLHSLYLSVGNFLLIWQLVFIICASLGRR